MTDFDFTLKDGVEACYSSEFFYDLTYGGYIKPHDLLKCKKTADAIVEAADLLTEFMESAVFAEEI